MGNNDLPSMEKNKQSIVMAGGFFLWLMAAILWNIDSIFVSFVFLPFFVFVPGYFFLKLLWHGSEKLTQLEGIILSIGLSFILSYPAGLINNLFEFLMNQEPFQVHRDSLILIYGVFTMLLILLTKKKQAPFEIIINKKNRREISIVSCLLILAFIFSIIGLKLQNINTDEQQLSLYSYHLIDGIFAGRKAFFISTSIHSPLGFFIAHVIYQIFEPFGYQNMNELVLRLPMIFFGLFELMMFYMFAKKIRLPSIITYLAFLIIAINSYHIFGSRLMIPQDGSILSSYILIFSYFLIVFLEGNNSKVNYSRLSILGLLLAAIFYIKLTAILLIPVIFIFWLFKKKSVLQLINLNILVFVIFSPVILFNLIAYFKIGYMDVAFSKLANIVGIPARSIMSENGTIYSDQLNSFSDTSLGYLSILIDQWSFSFSIFAFFGIICFLVSNQSDKKNDQYGYYFLSLFSISVLFFSLNGYRAYYSEFLTVPIMLVSIMGLMKHIDINKKLGYLFTISLLAISLLGSTLSTINTHWFVIEIPPGLSRDDINTRYLLNELSWNQSLSSTSFLSDEGFSILKERLKDENQSLIIENVLLDDYLHHFRWYLHINRDVEKYYLGSDYKDDYKYIRLSEANGVNGIYIYKYNENILQVGDELLKNHNGEPKMIIRYLKRQESLLPAPSMNTF